MYEMLTERRKLARNTMWYSLVCLLGSVATRMLSVFTELNIAVQLMACVPLIGGAISVLVTVLHFRQLFLPLIQKHSAAFDEKQAQPEADKTGEGAI